ncbi:hypothetical protein [Sphingomonas phyllosphaerae]|uniref:hypothetical protein n=1 Tax=Sphingomonas phyllosphaerae TaxID=257003 RepID=UPI00048CE53E|nr:hypothetical protein [Sphingomonas phyllosphaerae]
MATKAIVWLGLLRTPASATGLLAVAAGLLWLAGCRAGSRVTQVTAMLLIELRAGLPGVLSKQLHMAN